MDVCPAGYRIPVRADFVALSDETKVERTILAAGQKSPVTDIAYGNMPGLEFVDYATRDAVFFPFMGSLSAGNGAPTSTTHGYYWSATANDATTGIRISLNGNDGGFNPAGNGSYSYGFPVRCVKEVLPDVDPVVGGVTWANRNVRNYGAFTDSPAETGYYFQWGSLTPWSDTGAAVSMDGNNTTTWPTQPNNTTLNPWPMFYDPCPAGYTLPAGGSDGGDFAALAGANVTRTWLAANATSPATGILYGAQAGAEFRDNSTGDAVFFPATGNRHFSDGGLTVVGTDCFYWSATPQSAGASAGLNGYNLYVNADRINPKYDNGISRGMTIRCVKGDKGSPDVYGVEVGGVVWAKSNLLTSKGFVNRSHDAGSFFQWGVSTPWSATGDPYIVGTGDTTADTWPTNVTGSATDVWSAAQDPSPAGWRIPTPAEFDVLNDPAKVTATWLAAGTPGSTGITYTVNGYEFADVATPANVVFFPAAGYRLDSSGVLENVGSGGGYWSGTPQSTVLGYGMGFNSGSVTPSGSYDRTYGFSLRLVAK
jgi:uncharacterized protein (TIGR02145 family)